MSSMLHQFITTDNLMQSAINAFAALTVSSCDLISSYH